MSFGSHSIIYFVNGDIKVCGWNNKGQLGLNDKNNRNELVLMKNDKDIDQIACSFDSTFILKKDGRLYGVGSSEYGQMGIGNFEYSMNLSLILEGVSDVYCGYRYVICRMRNGTVMSFGRNDVGQIGIGSNTHASLPQFIFDFDHKIKMISCGGTHTLFLRENGEVLVCGWNMYGQLGLGNTKNVTNPTLMTSDPEILSIFCGGNYTFILKKTELVGFGENKWGQLGIEANEKHLEHVTIMKNHQIRLISCGGGHTLILKKNGDLFVCGKNDNGQLGIGHNRNISTPQLLMSNVDIISTGDAHSFVIQRSSHSEKLFVFGDGNGGRLGIPLKDEDGYLNIPQLLPIEHKIKLLPKIRRNMFKWTPEDHIHFGVEFQQQVLTMILFFKRNYKLTNLKIPKFILYEIISFLN